jgi:hypothetical protein
MWGTAYSRIGEQLRKVAQALLPARGAKRRPVASSFRVSNSAFRV